MQVLKAFADARFKRHDSKFSEIGIATELHGMRWFLHKASDETQRYYGVILESLAASGDLRAEEGAYYILTGKGLATLAQYETDDRRHRQNASLQWVLAILTAALILIGAGQLGVDFLNGQYTHSVFSAKQQTPSPSDQINP